MRADKKRGVSKRQGYTCRKTKREKKKKKGYERGQEQAEEGNDERPEHYFKE